MGMPSQQLCTWLLQSQDIPPKAAATLRLSTYSTQLAKVCGVAVALCMGIKKLVKSVLLGTAFRSAAGMCAAKAH